MLATYSVANRSTPSRTGHSRSGLDVRRDAVHIVHYRCARWIPPAILELATYMS